GQGTVVLYNLGERTVTGRLEVAAPSPVMPGDLGTELTLAPGERREIAVTMRVSAERWEAKAFLMRFVSAEVAPGKGRAAGEDESAVFSTALYPSTHGMTAKRVAGFDFGDNARQQATLARRALATGEMPLRPEGRWLVT